MYTHTRNQIKTKKLVRGCFQHKREESLISQQAKAPQVKIRVHNHM